MSFYRGLNVSLGLWDSEPKANRFSQEKLLGYIEVLLEYHGLPDEFCRLQDYPEPAEHSVFCIITV